MTESHISYTPLPDLPLWERMKSKRGLISFDLEVTARCTNNCRHCYINLHADDSAARQRELSLEEIKKIAEEAVSMGALWCLITGGEPLLRDDFFDLFLSLKKMGLLVSVFTNATLITKEHVRFFKQYPPRDIEITVYGVTQQTYETITRKPGSFAAFMQGLSLLFDAGVKVKLKSMALRSNLHELNDISLFCREKTNSRFRFDPFLHARIDRHRKRNDDINAERLTPDEIVEIERSDKERFKALEKKCENLDTLNPAMPGDNHIFSCGAGQNSFSLSHNGRFRLCASLNHPDCTYDLNKGSLADAWNNFVPKVRDMRSKNRDFLSTCRICPLINLCTWCPAHAFLETGELDTPVADFCRTAHARADTCKY